MKRERGKATHRLLTALKILARGLFLLPLPAFVFWFNQTSAETSARRAVQYEWNNAQALLSGETLYNADLLNSRLMLEQLIEGLTEPFDTIALGSSRILQMSSAEADGGTFYNCGLSGADYRDVMNTFYLFDKADMLPKNLIIGLDPWLLNANPAMLHHRSDAALFEEFLSLRLGYRTGYAAPEEGLSGLAEWLSPVLLQQNLALRAQPAQVEPPAVVQGNDALWDLYLKRPDGSESYTREYREAPQEQVNQNALQEALTFLRMKNFAGPDEELCVLFHRFVQYVQSRGVNVIFFLAPYHPLVYDFVTENAHFFPGFFLVEPWFIYYAATYDIPLYGSYNPYITQHGIADFYDGLHIRGEYIPRIFPGVRHIASAARQGEVLRSPWLSGLRARVEYPTAQAIIRRRYSVPVPQPLLQGADTVIRGELCYTVERYTQEGGTWLATYAVNRRTGLAWRYDTILNTWVIDEQFPGVDPL